MSQPATAAGTKACLQRSLPVGAAEVPAVVAVNSACAPGTMQLRRLCSAVRSNCCCSLLNLSQYPSQYNT